ncbi:MAG: hypothetical protein ABEJ78_03330 [Haloferacaceae archaeon]
MTLVVVLTFSTPTVGAASGPMINVSVDGDTVPDGGRVVTQSPDVSVTVLSETALDKVVVRVDDENVVDSSPNETKFETTIRPELNSGSNTVQVIVTVDNRTTTHLVHVYQDTLAPDIGLSSPFTVTPGHVFPTSVERASTAVSIRGTVSDRSSVRSFEAEIRGGGRAIGTSTIENGSFVLNTTLTTGNQSLVLSATDEYGNEEFQRVRIHVTDEDEPTITLPDWPNNTTTATIRTTLQVNDSVGIQSLFYRIPGEPNTDLLKPGPLLGSNRTIYDHPVELSFRHPGSYNVTFNATDYANHSTEITREVTYNPPTPEELARPDIVVHNNSSGLVDDGTYYLDALVQNGSVRNVVVESSNRQSGRVLSYERVYDGNATDNVTVERTLELVPGVNRIDISAVDAVGVTHHYSFLVDTANATRLTTATNTTENATTAQPTPTASTTPTTTNMTTISVSQPRVLTPVTSTKSPTSPAFVVVALLLVGLVARRAGE